MTSATGDFKEKDLGGIVEELFRLYWRNFLFFGGLVAVVWIPVAVLGALLGWYASISSSVGTGELILLLLSGVAVLIASVLASIIVAAAVAYAVARHYLGKTIAIGSTYRFALGRLGSLVGAALLDGWQCWQWR